MPVAISLFANLLGLGGIADTIKGIIEKVQDTVDKAIDKLIDRVMAMFQGKGDGAEDGEGEPEVPKSLIEPHQATLDNMTPELATAVSQAPEDSVIYQASVTDPKEVTRNLLANHPDAQYNRETRQLTLPAVSEAALAPATTLDQLGQTLAEQTGVSKVSLTKSGDTFALHMHINPEDTGATGKLPADEKRVIYQALAKVRDEVLKKRAAAKPLPDQASGSDAQIAEAFDHAMHAVAGLYQSRCAARFGAIGDNVFDFAGAKYFVDQDANYIFPNNRVGQQHTGILDTKFYVCGNANGGPITAATRDSDQKRKQVFRDYSYGKHELTPPQLRALAVTIATNGTIPEDNGAMFLATMVAEPSRNDIAHATNLLLMKDNADPPPNLLDKNNPPGTSMPMAAGGSATGDKPRDNDLRNIVSNLAPQQVTDKEIAVVRTQFEKQLGQPLSEAIASWRERAVDELVSWLLQLVNNPHVPAGS